MSREAVLTYLGVGETPAPADASGTENQAIGEYCQGRHVDECRKMFNEGLAVTCARCPD